MKKNLRIVSVAAAALLAVAPIAATAMPVNAATTATTATTATNKPTVDLSGAGSVSESKDTVNVTPSFTLTSAIATNSGVVTTPATLQGSIEASLNGTSVTADVADVAKDVTLKNGKQVVYSYDNESKKLTNNLGAFDSQAKKAYVEAGTSYTMTLSGVGFSFGKANANKTLTFKLPKGVTVEGANYKDGKVTLDQYGNVTGLKFTLDVKAYNSENTSAVSFYDAKSGLVAPQGSYMTLAQNGDLNVNTLLTELKGKYEAMQFQSGKFETVNVNTTADDVKAELEKAGIKVDAAGNFEAPDTFTVTLNAKSDDNGKTASLPVVVTVPNGKSTVAPSVSKTIMHNAYYYNKEGKRVGTEKATRYDSVTVAPKTTTINGKTYYQVVENGKAVDKYINAGNIDGTKRTLKHNAYVYKTSKKRANKVVLKKGDTVTTYGASYKFKNGKRYYKIGNNTDKTYVKVANFQ
ncbi:SLAP domain-containing protein [Lactobacillus kefiranofaciens]|uniref:S-layer protein n=1 Tax=Lactobacillus kefiranofaciens TaxID=267818 RepID=A0AAX3UBP6_9LACO|nr:SLAP domain-containing protein [Lactobacillus kefiranofaciens]AEG41496.1 Surface layer protein [Lactobacillus kefiranofaciens subsp. kefiranofaciens]KRM20707.1 surface layer protein [Lactobacillus kefiranofaciens subsp. kefiranofaciens DSM 5016 = JCM 6985]QFQ67206.1 S-layer protein [Lactobacillus kefiranofaciens subsp. kefiranofaciens]WGO85094.1 SLAP domain-containing protein [Lactobacillus kefiranofaciens]WQH35627.1 SLAP domain-containing protein [Lactobacillus kefiranofaciens]